MAFALVVPPRKTWVERYALSIVPTIGILCAAVAIETGDQPPPQRQSPAVAFVGLMPMAYYVT